MKVIKEVKIGTVTRTTVELSEHERMRAFDTQAYYRLPDIEDVVYGETLADAEPVSWCQLSQKWVS